MNIPDNNDCEVKFSIIIPHKNSYDLLIRQLVSIPEIDKLEILIVDDNSSEDQVGQLKNHQYKANTRIIYNNQSEGAGKARNIGLENARGIWIIFADADDFFSPNLKEILLASFDAPQEVIYFGTHSIFPETGKSAFRHTRYLEMVENAASNPDQEDALRFGFTPPWGKMIRRKVIDDHHIRFEEIWGSDDILFAIKLGYHASSILANPQVLYYITVTNGNQSSTFNKRIFDYRFRTSLKANQFLRSIGKGKYQFSVLYFLGRSHKFGWKYTMEVMLMSLRYRSNIFVGMNKIFNYKSIVTMRENPAFLNGKS